MKNMILQTKKDQEVKETHKESQLQSENNHETISEKKFYETPWFWICITVIIMCLTRPFKFVVCGNGNGNNNRSDGGNAKN